MTKKSTLSKNQPKPASLSAAAADDGDEAETTRTRRQVSKRDYLDSDGAVCDKIEQASGARYTLLGDGGRNFDEQFGDPGTFETMCAIFGFHTKVGNVANTTLNDKDNPGTPADAAAAIEEFIEAAKSGTWAERTGGVGIVIDKDALAGAVVAVATAQGKNAEYATIRQRMEEEAGYVKKVRQVPEVAMEYTRRVGKNVKSVDDILS